MQYRLNPMRRQNWAKIQKRCGKVWQQRAAEKQRLLGLTPGQRMRYDKALGAFVAVPT
jgi:hypothetical protein